MPILEAQSVYKTYRLGRVEVPVLRGASITVEQGEWVAVLGASGSGKSTLLHILGGLDRPDRKDSIAGSVIFRGVRLDQLSSPELDRYRSTDVGFVFQFYHLLPELTVLQNVLIAAMTRHGLAYWGQRRTIRQRATDLLTSFGLGHRLRHRPAELSGGERQRVAIARALINDPPVLLADEPTGNLDRKTGNAILDSIAEHRTQTGRTLIVVTHDQEVARRADRIVRLEDGKVSGVSVGGVGVPPASPG